MGIAPPAVRQGGAAASAIEHLTAWSRRPPVRQRAIRHLSAHKEGSSECAWIIATTTFDPQSGMSFTVDEEGGPRMLRRRMRQILEQEREAWDERAPMPPSAWAITADNYELSADEAAHGDIVVTLRPRRPEPWLLDGFATLTEHGELRRIEGRASHAPSFWLRNVSVDRVYMRVGPRTMLTTVTSLAQVRWFGAYRFLMTFRYQMVDGQTLTRLDEPHHAERPVPAATPRCDPG